MANPFLYDFKRTLTSKSVLIAMLALIMLSMLIFPDFSPNAPATTNSTVNSNTSQVFVFYDASGYHFMAFAWNQFGKPMSGVKFDVNVSVPSMPSGIVSGTGMTNVSGVTQFTIAVPENNGYSINLVASSSSGKLVSGTYAPFSSGTLPGETVSLFQPGRFTSPSTPTTVSDISNTSARNILVSWAGINGSAPIGYEVYYKFVSSNQSCYLTGFEFVLMCGAGTSPEASVPLQLNQANAVLLGTMNSYIQILPAPQQPDFNASEASDTIVAIGLTYPNGTIVPGSTNEAFSIPVAQLYPGLDAIIKTQQVNLVAISFFEDVFGLFIPLLAIITTYSIYGKDRVSGVLESVLAQPVTRGGLSLSRYASSFFGMSIAILVSVMVLDLVAERLSHSFINPDLLASSAGALMVELAAFIGIMMFVSHLVKSSGTLIGIGVALFFVVDLFQGLIVTLVTSALRIQSGSADFYKLSVGLGFANPTQFVTFVDTYLTNIYRTSSLGIATGSIPITPSSFGITIPAITASAVMWICIPLALFLYLAIKRD